MFTGLTYIGLCLIFVVSMELVNTIHAYKSGHGVYPLKAGFLGVCFAVGWKLVMLPVPAEVSTRSI